MLHTNHRAGELSAGDELDHIIHFADKEPRKHNLLAGAAIASIGLPLAAGSGKFASVALRPKIARIAGKLIGPAAEARIGGHGRQVMDYIEGAQNSLNRGLTGKVAGTVLKHPPGGLSDEARAHFSSFRASPTEAMDSWAGELAATLKERKSKALKPHLKQYEAFQIHKNKLMESEGRNEIEAMREAAADPRHEEFMRRMIVHKGSYASKYAKASAAGAAVPIGAGALVASSTRKDKTQKLSAQEELNLIQLGLRDDIATYKALNLKPAGRMGPLKLVNDMTTKSTLAARKGMKVADFFEKARKSRASFKMSAREQLNTILFADPRPRNPLGEFSGGEEGGPTPDAIDIAYKQPQARQQAQITPGGLAAGAAGGAAFTGGGVALKALLAKLKGTKGAVKASARDEPDSIINFDIEINPKNKGKFTATKKKTGKSTEELAHSKNPLTRKRAQFAENAKHWHHGGKKEMSARYQLDRIIRFGYFDPNYIEGQSERRIGQDVAGIVTPMVTAGGAGIYGGIQGYGMAKKGLGKAGDLLGKGGDYLGKVPGRIGGVFGTRSTSYHFPVPKFQRPALGYSGQSGMALPGPRAAAGVSRTSIVDDLPSEIKQAKGRTIFTARQQLDTILFAKKKKKPIKRGGRPAFPAGEEVPGDTAGVASALSARDQLDRIIHFDDDDEDEKKHSIIPAIGAGAGLIGGGIAGTMVPGIAAQEWRKGIPTGRAQNQTKVRNTNLNRAGVPPLPNTPSIGSSIGAARDEFKNMRAIGQAGPAAPLGQSISSSLGKGAEELGKTEIGQSAKMLNWRAAGKAARWGRGWAGLGLGLAGAGAGYLAGKLIDDD